MELIERIERFIEYKQLSVSGFEKSISASNGVIRHAILKKTDIYSRFLVKILDNYPELSADWLLREEGEILREPDQEKPSDTTVSILLQRIEDLARENGSLQAQIDEYKKRDCPFAEVCIASSCKNCQRLTPKVLRLQ